MKRLLLLALATLGFASGCAPTYVAGPAPYGRRHYYRHHHYPRQSAVIVVSPPRIVAPPPAVIWR